MAVEDLAAFVKKYGIIAMFSDDVLMERLVLKGGNAMELIYKVSTRASIDLDFSIDGDFDDVDDLRRRVERAIASTFAAVGYVAFDINLRDVPPNLSEEMHDFWGGYKIDFKIIERARHEKLRDDIVSLRNYAAAVGVRGSTRFTIDLSRHEYCQAKEEHDFDGFTIWVYSPACYVGEKIRSICQQRASYVSSVRSHRKSRAQDFVDIHVVSERFGVNFASAAFQELVARIFEAKKVPLTLIAEIHQDREQHGESFQKVKDTVNPSFELQEFDFYFAYVLEKSRLLEPLWNP